MKLGGYLRNACLTLVLITSTGVHSAEVDQSPSLISKLDFDTMVMIQRRSLNPTHVYTYHVEGLQKGGGLYVKKFGDEGMKRLIDASEGVILDCQVSYDGSRILFSWKRTMDETFGIWSIKPDGSGLARVIDHESNNFNACWLPDGGIAFLSDRKPAFAYCWTSTSPVLYRADGDGGNVIRLSANYLTDFTPSVMRDGRILYSRWEYVDRPAIPIQSLWAVNPDGTMLSGVFGNRVLSPATFMEARDIPGMPGKILCVMTSHNGPCRGAIGLLDPGIGGNSQDAIRNLTPEIPIGKVEDASAGNAMRGPYESPVPLDAHYYLVSRDGTIQLRDYDGKVEMTLCAPDQGLGFYSAQPLRGRPLPHKPPVPLVNPEAKPVAEVLVHNVTIGLGDAVKPGEIKRIAVVQEMEKDLRSEVKQRQFGFQFPVVSCGATYAPKRVWGFADVEKDGSAHFEVPSGVPLYFLPLDAEGRAVQRMRTFTHFMPGERQSCIGCHSDRNYVSTAAVGAGSSIASGRKAEKLEEPSWGSLDGFSFARVVQPVLNKNCVSCHNDKSALDLSGDRTDYFNVAYENLARRGTQAEHGGDARGGMAKFGRNPYTSWIPSFNGCESNILEVKPKTWGSPVSPLADLLINGHPDKKGVKRIDLSFDDRQRILMWIDLNVPYYGTSQSRQPDLRGCRQIVPKNLDAVLNEISTRRGIELPRNFFIRLDHPEKNPFLAVPLARKDFASTEDPDYQRILACFTGVQETLEQRIDVDYRTVIQADALSNHTKESPLESDFTNPPVKTRPYVWWHWMGSNFSKEGITKDLEAMKASGIGGATIFNIASAVQESHKPTLNNPWPDQTYRSPKYWEALRHAAVEADRLGLEIGLHNTVGYSTTGGPWIDEEKNMQSLVSKSVTVEGGKRVSIEIPRPDPTTYRSWGNSGRSFKYFKDIAILAVPATGDIDPSKVIDLTASFKDGRLDWDAPGGQWQVFRLCHAPTGANPHPLPDELIGKTLEVDKLSRDLNIFHWDQVIEPMKKHLGPYLGKSFKHFLIDSYEAGRQSWTPAFREEFQKRKGYDPLPWLLTLQNRTVGNKELSARFAWDYDDVIRALYYENGWRTGHEKMKAVGMDLQFEPYGGQFDTIDGAALADIPMGEFWTGKGGGISGSVVAAARAAGRKVVGAEAFTGPPAISKWSETPAFLKQSADGTYASGANRMILHHWVHQPFDDRHKPGMGMGWWGTHFNRHQTWAKDGKAFYQYLGRTQALLQAGETPSDFVSIGKSQGSDIISWREFREGVKVHDGRIVLSSGRSYPFLGIPHDGRLSPHDVGKIKSLLEQGAVIVCAKPSGAPGLSGYPQSDAEVNGSTLWNGGPASPVGKGKLYTKGDVADAIRDLKITPLMQFPEASGIVGTARMTKDETLFFMANTTDKNNSFSASFRVSGRSPELWDAADGSIRPAPVWREKNGRTEVDLTLGAYRSIFVVFRDSKRPVDHIVSVVSPSASADLDLTVSPEGSVTASSSAATRAELVFASGKRQTIDLPTPAAPVTLAGPWTLTLDSPVDTKQTLTLPGLVNLANHSEAKVRYFSGTASYSVKFQIPDLKSPVHLDLGKVHDLARVTLNGKDLGVLWQAPFTLDISSALKPGENLLEIAVTNTWHNRLVGDEQFPADFEWGEDRGDKGHAMKAYPDWFVNKQPRPEQGRKCFVVWYYHRKDTPLLPAGLIGPVRLIPKTSATVNR